MFRKSSHTAELRLHSQFCEEPPFKTLKEEFRTLQVPTGTAGGPVHDEPLEEHTSDLFPHLASHAKAASEYCSLRVAQCSNKLSLDVQNQRRGEQIRIGWLARLGYPSPRPLKRKLQATSGMVVSWKSQSTMQPRAVSA